MSALPVQEIQASVSGDGSFTFYNDQIVVISQEGYIKYFEIISRDQPSLTSLKVLKNVAVNKQLKAIASNGKDVIVHGGDNKEVQTVFRDKFEKPSKIYHGTKNIHKLIYPNSRVILILTEDSHMNVYWVEEEKSTKVTALHDQNIVNADVDPQCEFIATTGLDGTI